MLTHQFLLTSAMATLFASTIPALPQPGLITPPCPLEPPGQKTVSDLKITASATEPFTIKLNWSGPPGIYTFTEVGGTSGGSVGLRGIPDTPECSPIRNPTLKGCVPLTVVQGTVTVEGVVPPASPHTFVVKGTGLCGMTTIVMPEPPGFGPINGQYIDVHHVTLTGHVPAYVHSVNIYRAPRNMVEQPAPSQIPVTTLQSTTASSNLDDGSSKSFSTPAMDPGPPPFPYVNAQPPNIIGQYNKAPASYQFFLEAVWTANPDGSGAKIVRQTPFTINGPEPIVGYADLHSHMFAYLGFGGGPQSYPMGRHFFGKAFGQIDQSLPHCDGYKDANGVQRDIHGPGGTGDLANYIMQAAQLGQLPANTGHKVGGYPEFDGWPRWNSFTHQAYFEDWLKRAHDKGLKLIVTHPVNNEWMCTTLNHFTAAEWALAVATGVSAIYTAPSVLYWQTHIDPDCLDKPSAENQINETFAMQNDIDTRSGGQGKGWFRVVKTPEEARQIISQGKLAVVIGMEVDNPFECTVGNTGCTDQYVKDQVQHYYELGVRHFFPIHFYDNAFGGSANSNALISDNFTSPMQKESCTVLGESYSYDSHQCNTRSLTSVGNTLIKELMAQGMIIDVDHMSELTFDFTMNWVSQSMYPVVSGHAGFNEINRNNESNEGNRSPTEIGRILGVGGMFAIIPHQGDKDDVVTYPAGSNISHTCGNSSETVVQAYRYAVAHTGGGPVGFGTDMNGFAGWPSPRFGPDACSGGGYSTTTVSKPGGGTTTVPKPMLDYKTAMINATGIQIRVDQSQVGNKTFDYNIDGLAHIGMLPDMIADFEVMGMQPQELDPLFFSTEGYIRLWERAEYMKTK